MIKIREAKDKDSDQIWSIFKQVVAKGDTYTYPPDISREQALEAWVTRPGNSTFVAEIDGIVRGTYHIRPNWPGAGAHVSNGSFMVDEQARGSGIGYAMGEHALSTAKSLGYKAMQFNLVISTNKGAIHLWKKLGFETIGTIPEAFNHPKEGLVDALIMHRRL